jgi:predicted ATPase
VGSRRSYQFQHVLIRDAAYETLYTAERRELHGRVAEVLLEDAEVGQRAPERLAHHLSASGDEAGAVEWWLRAGERAIAHSAHREGCDHLERGLAIVRSLPSSRDRDRQELAFLTHLGAASSVLRGYSATEVEQTWDRAQDLCRSLTTSPQLFWVVWGSWSFHLVRGELRKALELGSWLVSMAQSLGDSSLGLVAHGTLGLARYFLGDLGAARQALETARELDDPQRGHLIASASGQDAGVVVHATHALVLWHLGDDEGAVAASRAAVALAERVGSSYSLAFAHVYAARLHQSRRDLEALRHHAGEVMRLSGEKGYFWLVQGQFFLACGIGETARRSQREGAEDEAAGLYREAILALSEAFAGYRGVGARVSSTYMLAQWAELHLWAGEPEMARERLAQGFELLEEGEEGYWRPELWRLEGLLRRAEGRGSEAREALDKALELARESGDRAFEARVLEALGEEP